MKVAILTMFNGLSKTYSLVSVVEEHLHMLLGGGMKVKVLVSQDCPDSERYGIYSDERIEWVKITNRLHGEQIHWLDYTQPTGRVHPTFFQEADVITDSLYEALQDVDVVFLHDILYQGWHLVHNVAVRQVQVRLPRLRFLAMNHSYPAVRPKRMDWPLSARFMPLPNTTYLYPAESGLTALAEQYMVLLEQCRAIPNSLNLYGGMGEDIQRLGGLTDLLTPDILAVYPGRLTPGKQMEKAATLLAVISAVSGKRVKLVFCDFPSLDIEPAAYKRSIRDEGERYGLGLDALVFTSDLGWPDGFPHRGVMDLFTLSNLFICTSYSESFGLIVLEAASRGNMLVLNQAVPALEELGHRLQAYFMRWHARGFGVDTRESYHPSEEAYLREHAEIIAGRMNQNPVIQAKTITRQQYNPHWIWEHRLKPLIEI
ncbi:glycosyltransferase [Paenibacillus glycanilyticus]|uniref:glycosyltransferase n=1 Tax=Paenibacillus glycanilyticus TaxID=126569 RepID=UPI002041E002|nr:glycosyltransferase [Paenibacillus glycanilyticus]MCM3627833.1 glycosyltransferase [Paenibacillus glycanilyticus]